MTIRSINWRKKMKPMMNALSCLVLALALPAMVADITIFDPEKVTDNATYKMGEQGYIQKWGLLAVLPSHQWNIAGWGTGDENDYSTTQLQAFAMFTPGGGWAVGTQPIMTYDWENSDWTIPLNLYIS